MGLLDFLVTYAPMRAHPAYVTRYDYCILYTYTYALSVAYSICMCRRRWRVLDWAAPSLGLSAETDPYGLDYPFSVKAERILTPKDLMDIQVCWDSILFAIE